MDCARPLDSIAGFAALLREHGLKVGVAEQQAFVQAALAVPVQRAVKLDAAWRAIACQNARDWRRWPDLFERYYLEQFTLLQRNHSVTLEVGTSTQPIPVHFSFAEHDHIEGSMALGRRLLMRDVFDLPDLAAMDDGIANGTHE